MGAWQWGVRMSAFVGKQKPSISVMQITLQRENKTEFGGIIVLALLVMIADEPKRGAAEEVMGAQLEHEGVSSYWQDIKSLACIPTFVFCTWAYAALVFVAGTLTWWEPTIIKHLIAWHLDLNSTQLLSNSEKDRNVE
ncbi:hypothetical protein KIN20_037062 [Parelaphostrongylus tenuis]|uniref:Uncharacterized protein n=1 Tax=Parelaphostrongylus tenuis TaxID=148309 RepID=A0AAD5RE77_PARTN|nr:hypothetical protein KIN20_037062 [Parelaphostrongylus tenuis]